MDTLQVAPYPSMQLPAVSREGSQAEIAEYPDGVALRAIYTNKRLQTSMVQFSAPGSL